MICVKTRTHDMFDSHSEFARIDKDIGSALVREYRQNPRGMNSFFKRS